ncbi:3-phosphoserine/phosphohydroxythreonine transaminase [Rhodothermus bifroesti]|uniref:3-phosphoserine/phosphohydroxythreonine transaminase n=1 Tax=Rhodothermus bifroesti TaxID=2823335 RepID=UPI001AEFA7FC|nr:3-phosphoserine/phosphohydroxythreonine transaminase [Rhodothermus bifroesti]
MTQPATLQTPVFRTATGRVYNFSAGPAVLPESVLLEVKEELPMYRQLGTSILEISHRSPEYTAIAESAKSLLRKLLGLDETWHVLFLQGGASLQFYQVPLNFLPPGGSADYLITGHWAKRAFQDAQLVGRVRVAASSEDRQFCAIPDPSSWDLDPQAAYLHFTSNNTIYGTQFPSEPEVSVPLVCDASSDFLSRRIDPRRYGLIYAGAQKNVGPAGVTLVLVREDFLQRRNQPLPPMLDYGVHAAKLFNTPPVFAVYIVEKVLRWLEGLGGLPAIEAINNRKAELLYRRIDQSDFYRGTAEPASRSKMNVTFRLPSETLEKQFIEEAQQAGLIGLKGHRLVGGLRASIYNACPIEAVEALISFMDYFEQRYG